MSAAAHELVSTHLLQTLHGLYRLARPSLRNAALESAEGLRFREGAAAWSLDRRREWMLARLRHNQTLAAAQSVKHPPGWRDSAAAWTEAR